MLNMEISSSESTDEIVELPTAVRSQKKKSATKEKAPLDFDVSDSFAFGSKRKKKSEWRQCYVQDPKDPSYVFCKYCKTRIKCISKKRHYIIKESQP